MVRGFIEDNFVSFSKQYQSTIILEDDGTETLVKGLPGQEIAYWGVYDSLTSTLEGKWEFLVYLDKYEDGYIESVFWGTWKLIRN